MTAVPLTWTMPAFVAFRALWAAAELVHLVSFGLWIYEPAGIALFGAAIAVLLKPTSLWRFFVLCVCDVVHVFVQMPNTANHILFNGLVNLTIVLVMVRHLPLSRTGHWTPDRIYGEFAPLVRIELLLLYFFAVFHKLNEDFFRPEVSCAGVLFRGLSERFVAIPASDTMISMVIWATLIVEAAIPVMLVWSRTRYAGILIGIVFHLTLGLHPRQGLYSFSTMLFVLYTLFLPDDYVTRLGAAIAARPRIRSLVAAVGSTVRRSAKVVVLAGAVVGIAGAVLVLLTGVDLRHLGERVLAIGGVVWVPFALAALVAVVWIVRMPGKRPEDASALLSFSWSLGLIGPVLIIANSFSPYLGFHTRRNLSMFSNLRTEGERTNHLLVPREIQVADYQRDLVEVLASSDSQFQALPDSGYLLPYFELRRRVMGREEPLEIRFLRAGKLVEVSGEGEDLAAAIPPVPWLAGKLMRFRAVDKAGPALCRW